MSYQAWLKCITSFDDDMEIKPCPNCGKDDIRYQFVGDKATNFGNLYLWCDSCKHGIHVSSVKLPKDADVLPFNAPKEEFNKKIPEYKLVNN